MNFTPCETVLLCVIGGQWLVLAGFLLWHGRAMGNLLNRLMSRDYTEYQAGENGGTKTPPLIKPSYSRIRM